MEAKISHLSNAVLLRWVKSFHRIQCSYVKIIYYWMTFMDIPYGMNKILFKASETLMSLEWQKIARNEKRESCA